jgi:hypothetical protein
LTERSYGTGFSLRPAGGPAAPPPASLSLVPLPAVAMTKIRDFVSGLARARKSANEIKILTDAAFGDKSLTKTAIYNILKKVKAGETTDDLLHLNAKKTKRTQDIIAAVAADVNVDRRVKCMDLATAHGVSYGTMQNILHKELGLVKKSARWVPKLLSEDQKWRE